MKKNLQIASLIDLYGALLTDRQREIVSGYYEFDLSLGEMAENLGVTRQAVRDALSKAAAALEYYEQSFKLNHIRNQLILAAQSNEIEKDKIVKNLIDIIS